ERKMRGAGLGEEALGLVAATAIDIDGHHLEVLAAECRFEVVERWHFLPAGYAPRGPDVEQHHLAPPVAQGLCRAAGIDEADFGKSGGLWHRQEPRHGALVQPSEWPLPRRP